MVVRWSWTKPHLDHETVPHRPAAITIQPCAAATPDGA